jgi:CBS domain-containing protein
MKQSVRDVLRAKGPDGRHVWTIGPEATVFEALEMLAEKDIGSLVVCEGEKVVGIFSERDYARKIIMLKRRSQETSVRDIMSPRVLCVTPERTMDECMALMTSKRVRHLPVLEDGKLAGLVSIGDVVHALISEREFIIEQLTNYIQGS